MLPKTMPTLLGSRVTLREFRAADASFVQSVSDDPLIPLITTVPASGTVEDALAYIARQHDRLRTGAGYSFAIAENLSAQPVGQIGSLVHSFTGRRPPEACWVHQARAD